MPPAAQVTNNQVCPMVTPGLPPIPHVGGPINGPGVPTVLVGGLPASCVGDVCVCVGPPSTITLGFPTVLVGGKPITVVGMSITDHGGSVVGPGAVTVLIG